MNDSRIINTPSEKSHNFDSEYYNLLLKQIDESQERVKQTTIVIDKIKARKEIQILQDQLDETGKSQSSVNLKEISLLVKIGDEFLILEVYQQALIYYRKAVYILQNSDDNLYRNDSGITLVDLLMRISIVFRLLDEHENFDLTYSKLMDISDDEAQVELIKLIKDLSITQDNIRVLIKNNFKSLEEASNTTNNDVLMDKTQMSNINKGESFMFFLIILFLVIVMFLLVIQLSLAGR